MAPNVQEAFVEEHDMELHDAAIRRVINIDKTIFIYNYQRIL